MRLSKKRLATCVGLVAAVVTIVAATAGVGDARPSKAASGYKIYLIPKFIGIPVFTQNNLGAQLAAKELGDKVTYNGPTTASATGQVQFINTAMQQGYNAIIISADDPNAVAPALKRAAAKGIKVISYDGDAAPDARYIYVSPPDAKSIGESQVEWLGSTIGYKGQIAILSAAPTAANQNTWIAYMKAALKLPKYKNMQLVKIVYGNDDDTKSAQEMQALLQAYPNLKGVISPTTVGVAAAARVLTQQKECGKVQLTGLGLPSQMRTYVKSGCVKKVGLWSETDFGYLAEYVAHDVLAGKLTNAAGQVFRAGHLGARKVIAGHTVILSKPIVFTKATIDKYHF
jgi:rhamnose transport system substrate-binding protein